MLLEKVFLFFLPALFLFMKVERFVIRKIQLKSKASFLYSQEKE